MAMLLSPCVLVQTSIWVPFNHSGNRNLGQLPTPEPSTRCFPQIQARLQQATEERDKMIEVPQHSKAVRGPKDHRNVRIRPSASKAQDQGDFRNHGICRIRMLRWSFRPLKATSQSVKSRMSGSINDDRVRGACFSGACFRRHS